MSKVRKIIFTAGIILILLILWGYFNIWRSPKYFLEKNTCKEFQSILTMEEYSKLMIGHSRPYIIHRKNIFIFGAEHINNPANRQIQDIETSFYTFNPTVVLVEGRLGFLIPYVMDPVKRFGEMGKVAELAKINGLPLYSWDAPKSEQLQALRHKFEPEKLSLKEILNPYFSHLRFGKPASPEKFVEQYLHRAAWLGVQDKIASIEDIDRIWQRDFPTSKDWRDVSDQWRLPGYLAQMADDANFIRNQHLVCVINQLLDQGESVFVVCGSSHAVCIENEIN